MMSGFTRRPSALTCADPVRPWGSVATTKRAPSTRGLPSPWTTAQLASGARCIWASIFLRRLARRSPRRWTGWFTRWPTTAARRDYGPVLLLRHATGSGRHFFTLYGHLSRASLAELAEGQAISAGEPIGWIGEPPENGDWPPHLHLQIIVDPLDLGCGFPGVAAASQRPVWLGISPDPNLLLGIPQDHFPPRAPSQTETLGRAQPALEP